METVPRVTVPLCLFVVLAAGGCHKEEQQNSSEPVASATAGVSASAEATAPPVDADTLTLQYKLGDVPIPTDNPQTKEKIELGHQLFFDKRLSVDGSRSCYSCHQNEDGTGGHEPLAVGAKGKQLDRHAPEMWNVGYAKRLYWDGRAPNLEAQVLGAWAGGPLGVGKDKLEAKAKELGKIPGYKKQFAAVFPKKGATPETVSQAISAYERTLVCDDTAYDRYAKGDKKALSDEQKRGLVLFTGTAGCTTCHTPPFFSIAFMSPEGAYFNVGIGTQGKPESEVDVGRMAVTKKDADWAAFKPPSLRNVAKMPPYFHDGSVKTLKEAVQFMASGGAQNKNHTPLLTDKKLSEAQIDDIVAFLGSLDCGGKLEEPKLPK